MSGPAQWSSVCRKKTWSQFRRPLGTIAASILAGSRPSEASFFKYICQPKGYISKGEDTIDTQSIESATLEMITIIEILPQFIQ